MTFGSSRVLLFITVWVFVITACAEVPTGVPARGNIGGQQLEVRVDSSVAQYYLTNYLEGRRTDPPLDRRIDGLYKHAEGRVPDREELHQISEEFSLDFASLYFADRITKDPENHRFQDAFESSRTFLRQNLQQDSVTFPPEAQKYEVMFVPGYLYRAHAYTGADFTVARRALDDVGLRHHFVETDEDGPVEQNATLVARAIKARMESGRRLLLVSASKSGPEVALALTNLGAEHTRHVGAWVNIVGTLQGSFLADEGIQQEHEALFGEVDPLGVESLTTQRSRERFATFRIPEGIVVVNYIGIPLTSTISSWAKEEFFTLKKYGPNDGLSLLADLLMPGGLTLTEFGQDHFLLNNGMDETTLALAMTIIRWLEDESGYSYPTMRLQPSSGHGYGAFSPPKLSPGR